jgi:hypothetical protein
MAKLVQKENQGLCGPSAAFKPHSTESKTTEPCAGLEQRITNEASPKKVETYETPSSMTGLSRPIFPLIAQSGNNRDCSGEEKKNHRA